MQSGHLAASWPTFQLSKKPSKRPVRTLPGQPIRQPVVFARDVLHAPRRKTLPHMHDQIVQHPQPRITHFVLAADLADEQFAVGFDGEVRAAQRQRLLLRAVEPALPDGTWVELVLRSAGP